MIQHRQRHTTHISCLASEAGKEALFQANMNDEFAPSQKQFLTHNTVEFEKFFTTVEIAIQSDAVLASYVDSGVRNLFAS